MPVLTLTALHKYETQLDERFQTLKLALRGRELTTPSEGVKGRGHWIHPEKMRSTTGSRFDLAVAVEDFKVILAEIKKLQ